MLDLGNRQLLTFAQVVLLSLSELVEPLLVDHNDSLHVVKHPAGSGLSHSPQRPSQSGSFATISEEWLEVTSGSVQAKFLEVVRQGRVRDPQLCSNSLLGSSILGGDVPQFIAELFQVDSFPARSSTTFIAQAWGSDDSVLLLLVSFPHGRNLLARASKLLRDSLDVPMGQLAIFSALEDVVDHSVSLIFFQILSAYCPSSASSNGHGDQSMRK